MQWRSSKNSGSTGQEVWNQHTLATADTGDDIETHASADAQTSLPIEEHKACDDAGAESSTEGSTEAIAAEPEPTPAIRARRLPWARLLKRTLHIYTLGHP